LESLYSQYNDWEADLWLSYHDLMVAFAPLLTHNHEAELR
jgi:hypothetical protein